MFPTPCRPFSSSSYPTTQKVEGEQTSEPLNDTVVDLFDEWAAKALDRIAAEWQGEPLTYAVLRSDSLHVSQALL
ncbi:nonribosomal peptide synthase [Penicillium cf. griseofulvum]|uniref:Nonribosomal peptide synthase n=1 Tax=Penicillium cf. griseofulvum TaxID=2972120 RepID=A0A9W9JTF6_9EURO|nr:nonribosomal peptide synthase [Penicillium cf. griseofulvum]KAJ5423779.1 nonribosomal peptide synthase [Penicillium cf. griseofulvum]KAJ5430968.1 nonribosomal peptide synthase [Penicillium cf. griseofulvum]